MKFQGRITKILPLRSGTNQNGDWKALPFVFEYFENPTDRYADSVVLDTFDTKVIEHLQVGMEVICDFGHRVREIKKQNGEDSIVNNLRLYKIESVRKAATSQQQQSQQAPPFTNTQQSSDNPDDFPF